MNLTLGQCSCFIETDSLYLSSINCLFRLSSFDTQIIQSSKRKSIGKVEIDWEWSHGYQIIQTFKNNIACTITYSQQCPNCWKENNKRNNDCLEYKYQGWFNDVRSYHFSIKDFTDYLSSNCCVSCIYNQSSTFFIWVQNLGPII